MLQAIFFALWFFAPAGAGNMGAFFSGKIPALKKYNYPVDCYRKFRGKRVLGNHKTIRGFIFGIIVSILVVYLQIFLYTKIPFFKEWYFIDYNSINPLIFGALSGFGALAGDAVKSFFKRQLNIRPGQSWFPADQIDYILGGLFFLSFYVKLDLMQYGTIFAIWFLLHPLATFLGFLLRLKKSPL